MGKVVVEIEQWLAKKNNLVSVVMEGEVQARTSKAILFEGSAAVYETDYCMRCGKEIDNPVSRLVGYGPVCSGYLGIPREFEPEELQTIKEKAQKETKVKLWLPINFTSVLRGELPPVGTTTPRNGQAQKKEVNVAVQGNMINLKAPYQFKDQCAAIPGGRWDKKNKQWTYPATPTTAQTIVEKFPKECLKVDPAFDRLNEQAKNIGEAAKNKVAKDLPDVPLSLTEAWLHQRQAYWFAKELPAAMLAMDMGTGKSKVVVDLVVNRGHKRVLIVAPKSVINVWPREFKAHAAKDLAIVPLGKGSIKKRTGEARQKLREAEARNKPVVVIINYESYWREPFAAFSLEAGWDLVVLDESHRVKKPGGKASLFAKKLGQKVPNRVCLTGTPMPHSPLDVYAQFRFLDIGIYGSSYNRFKNKYAIMGGYGNYQVLGFQNEEEMQKLFYSISYRVGKDVLDLPEEISVTRTAALTPKTAKVYAELENHFITEVKGGQVTVLNALTKLLRLQQITSGYLINDEGEHVGLGQEKRDLLKDTLEDIAKDEPVVVFARFRHDLAEIREVAAELGRTYGELSGRRNDLNEDAKMPGGIDLMGVQIQSGGVGIDLTAACYAIYYSMGFSLGDYEQSKARVHRPGQTRTTRYIHLVAENTVDVKVARALQNRKEVVEEILIEAQKGDISTEENS